MRSVFSQVSSCTYKAMAEEMDRRTPGVHWTTSLGELVSSRFSEGLCFKINKVQNNGGRPLSSMPLCKAYTMYVNVYIQENTRAHNKSSSPGVAKQQCSPLWTESRGRAFC